MTPCTPNVSATGVGNLEAERLLRRLYEKAKLRAEQTGSPIDQALREIAGELTVEDKVMAAIQKRNTLLFIQAKRNVKDYVRRFKDMGEGLRAFLEGSNKVVPGARLSVDYQSKALHGKYFGRFVADLESEGVLSDFKRSDPEFTRLIYREMGAFKPGVAAKSVTGNKAAFKIASILENITAEMVARQNRAGAFIRRVPGYVVRQTHDMLTIRRAGLVDGKYSKDASYKAWSAFVKPLLDNEKTFEGADPELVLRNIHDGIYTGVHGMAHDETNIMGVPTTGDLARKLSKHRVIWFKDADSAFAYNQRFGQRQFKEATLQDIHNRARSIALMEALGPSPDNAFTQILRELQEEARERDDAATQIDSLASWRVRAAYDEVSGKTSIPVNPSMANMIGTGKAIVQMAKMGGVTLSSLADKAFIHSEMAYQGISTLDTFVKNLTTHAKRSPDSMRTLRLMGVAMDGLIGNALSRYTAHSQTSGWVHSAQKRFFDLNLLNAWTDSNKAGAAELMAAHLGEHANLAFKDLPDDLRKVLTLYDIAPHHWDAIRMTAYDHNGQMFITPDQLSRLQDMDVAKLVEKDGLTPTPANIARKRDQLDSALRTYFADRVDIAIPTPGAGDRKFVTWGTQPGTPLGEAVRLLMLFKSFPITVMRKIVGRNIYGNGAESLKQWFLHDHKGKFNMAMLIAMGTVAGYVSGAIRDTLKGRTPKPLILDDGSINTAALNDAALRGGSLGILGDTLMANYSSHSRSFLEAAAGPVLGQLNQVFDIKSRIQTGEKGALAESGKLITDNTPFINLFYIRPVLDYFILWNLQEMMNPGSIRQMEKAVREKNHQDFLINPTDAIR